MGKVKVSDMADTIMKELGYLKDVTEDDFEEIAKAIAKEGAKKLKETSPRGRGSKKGHYADGWGISYLRIGNGKFRFVVHNKKKPGLTHLLENGHQSNLGGYVEGITHIKPIEEWCNAEFQKRVEAKIGK